jgi:hypothetical protein
MLDWQRIRCFENIVNVMDHYSDRFDSFALLMWLLLYINWELL